MPERYARSYDEAVYGKLRGEPHYLFSTYAHYAAYFDNTDLTLDKWTQFFSASLRQQRKQEQDVVHAFDPSMTVSEFTSSIINRINDKDNFLFDLLVGDMYSICSKLFEDGVKDRVPLTQEQLNILLKEIENQVTTATNVLVDDIDKDRNKFLSKKDIISKEQMQLLNYMPVLKEIMQKKNKKGGDQSPTRNALDRIMKTSRREEVGSYNIGAIGETLLAQVLSQIAKEYKRKDFKVSVVGGGTSLTGQGKQKVDVTMGGNINFQMKAYKHFYKGQNSYANIALHTANSINNLEKYLSMYDTGANVNAFWAYFLNTYSMYLNGIMVRDPNANFGQENPNDPGSIQFNMKMGAGFMRIKELNQILGLTISIWMGSAFGLNGSGLASGLNVQGAEEITRNDFFVVGNQLVTPASHLMLYLFRNRNAVNVQLGASTVSQDELRAAYGKKLKAGPGLYNVDAIKAGVNVGNQFANTQVTIKADLALNRIAAKKFTL